MPRHVPDAERRLQAFQDVTGTDATTARGYLEAEEWDVLDAVVSYRGDQQHQLLVELDPRRPPRIVPNPSTGCAGACAFAAA